jgi:hypothetical protein
MCAWDSSERFKNYGLFHGATMITTPFFWGGGAEFLQCGFFFFFCEMKKKMVIFRDFLGSFF